MTVRSTTLVTAPYFREQPSDQILVTPLGGGVPLALGAIATQSTGNQTFAGVWNGATNSPTLVSGIGAKGTVYVVGTAGYVQLDGVGYWNVGDQVTFDGTVWRKISGAARIKLTSTLGLWVVGTTGNDATTDGTTFATAFKTLQGAINAAYARYDTQGNQITINVNAAAGPYTATAVVSFPMVGGGELLISGAGGVAAINVPNNQGIVAQDGAKVRVTNLSFSAPTAGFIGLRAVRAGRLTIDVGCVFTTSLGDHIEITQNSYLLVTNGGYTITGGASVHMHVTDNSMAVLDGQTITLTGTPAFSSYFYGSADGGHMTMLMGSIVGAATGPRYFIHYGATVRTSNLGLASATFFPGSIPGTIQRGGVLDNLGGGQIVQLVEITANTSLVFPVNGRITGITLANTSANAVTGGINIGTTALGSDVVSAAASAGNSFVDATVAKRVFSATADQTLYVSAASAWNSAVVTVCISYDAPAPPL